MVGGGSSLKDFNWACLRDVPRVIVVNRAYQEVPTADIFFTEDARFCAKYGLRDDFRNFGGVKVLHLLEDAYRSEILDVEDQLTIIRKTRSDKFWAKSLDEGLSVSSNSAVGAVNLAEILGAKTIFLLGMDCMKDGQNTNYHSDYSNEWAAGHHQLTSFASDWKHWVRPNCKATIINVINTKMPSKIDCFTAVDYVDFYGMMKGQAPDKIYVHFEKEVPVRFDAS